MQVVFLGWMQKGEKRNKKGVSIFVVEHWQKVEDRFVWTMLLHIKGYSTTKGETFESLRVKEKDNLFIVNIPWVETIMRHLETKKYVVIALLMHNLGTMF